MDLPTHLAFALAVGLVFFGRADVALVIGIGSLLPDLDREYWYIPEKQYASEQRHRALFHNVFVIAISYLVSPFLSMGVFLHILQDSFTTVKDRGVEWFYPLTRLVKRGVYDPNGGPQPSSPNEKVYFYQEDPPSLVKLADPDLQEPAQDPVPWRRVYGFALNGHVLDRGFLVGSAAVALVWILDPMNSARVSTFLQPSTGTMVILAGYLGIGLLFASGETQSSLERTKADAGGSQGSKTTSRLSALRPAQVPLFLAGAVLLFAPGLYFSRAILQNVSLLWSDPAGLLGGGLALVAVGLIVIVWETRGGRSTIV